MTTVESNHIVTSFGSFILLYFLSLVLLAVYISFYVNNFHSICSPIQFLYQYYSAVRAFVILSYLLILIHVHSYLSEADHIQGLHNKYDIGTVKKGSKEIVGGLHQNRLG